MRVPGRLQLPCGSVKNRTVLAFPVRVGFSRKVVLAGWKLPDAKSTLVVNWPAAVPFKVALAFSPGRTKDACLGVSPRVSIFINYAAGDDRLGCQFDFQAGHAVACGYAQFQAPARCTAVLTVYESLTLRLQAIFARIDVLDDESSLNIRNGRAYDSAPGNRAQPEERFTQWFACQFVRHNTLDQRQVISCIGLKGSGNAGY